MIELNVDEIYAMAKDINCRHLVEDNTLRYCLKRAASMYCRIPTESERKSSAFKSRQQDLGTLCCVDRKR